MHPKIFPPLKKNEFYHTQCPARHLTHEAANCNGKKRNCARRTIRRFIHSLNCAKKTKKNRLGNSAKRDIIAIRETAIPDCKLYLSTKQIRAIKALPGKGAEPPITGKCHAR